MGYETPPHDIILPLQDDFNRANENPMNPAQWDKFTTGNGFRIDNNASECNGAASGTAAFIGDGENLVNHEVWLEVKTAPVHVLPGGGRLYTRMSPTGSATYYGYALRFGTDAWDLVRYDGNSSTIGATLASGSYTAAAGDRWMIRTNSNTHRVFMRTSAGSWTLLGQGDDSTYTTGYTGMGVSNSGLEFEVEQFGCGEAFAGAPATVVTIR
jgi:hypothetical protein